MGLVPAVGPTHAERGQTQEGARPNVAAGDRRRPNPGTANLPVMSRKRNNWRSPPRPECCQTQGGARRRPRRRIDSLRMAQLPRGPRLPDGGAFPPNCVKPVPTAKGVELPEYLRRDCGEQGLGVGAEDGEAGHADVRSHLEIPRQPLLSRQTWEDLRQQLRYPPVRRQAE